MLNPDAIRPFLIRAGARLRGAFDKVLPHARRATAARLPNGPGRARASSSVLPGLDTRPAPMRPLHPPAAINDNPLEAIQEAVERELRARGHLR